MKKSIPFVVIASSLILFFSSVCFGGKVTTLKTIELKCAKGDGWPTVYEKEGKPNTELSVTMDGIRVPGYKNLVTVSKSDKGLVNWYKSLFFKYPDKDERKKVLEPHHKVHAIHITDPAEIKLPKAGALTLKSVKPSKQYHIDSDSLLQQENYETTAMDYFSLKKHLFENIAITYQQILTTDETIEHKITI